MRREYYRLSTRPSGTCYSANEYDTIEEAYGALNESKTFNCIEKVTYIKETDEYDLVVKEATIIELASPLDDDMIVFERKLQRIFDNHIRVEHITPLHDEDFEACYMVTDNGTIIANPTNGLQICCEQILKWRLRYYD